jgi:hypothetical protein
MRRVWIVVAGTAVIAGLVVGPTAAYAGTGTGRQASSSCTDLIKKYQKSNKLGAGVNFNDAKTLPKLFKQAGQILKSLAKNGPSELRDAFKHLANGFATLAKVDFTNPSSISQLSTFGAAYSSDLQKISAYFATKCRYTIPTAPNAAGAPTAGVPTS